MSEENQLEGTLSATVRVDNMPASRRIVALELLADDSWRICGTGVSDETGVVDITVNGDPSSNVYAMAVDNWGRAWEPNMVVEFGDIVRPSIFTGWMYRCTQPGTLPAEEPAWWGDLESIPQAVGTAMLESTRHYQPIAHGPVDITWEEPPAEPDLPTVLGEPFGGGFYAGDIQYPDGSWYKLIVADKVADIAGNDALWRTSTPAPDVTDSLTDGVANTSAMIAAGIELHPAANHCINHAGGGNSDWYMPARDELNVIYLNLGFNRPDCPPDFLSGGPQAFDSANYWTSTQYSSYHGWIQHFSTGSQSYGGMNNTSNRVRPVRRLQFNP